MLGLFHGLLVLPVLLALFGPPSRQPAVSTGPQNIDKATARASLHRDDDEGGQDINRAHLQQEIQNVHTSEAIAEITPLKDGGGEVEQEVDEVELEVERGGGGEKEEGFLMRGRGSSISIENTRA